MSARAVAHLDDRTESLKVARISEIRDNSLEPRIDIIAHGLRDDEEACRVEAAIIELIGVVHLTNAIRGLSATDFPRRPLLDFIMETMPERAVIRHPSLLIRINKLFQYGMSELALYGATRGIWVIGERRGQAKLAMAVYAGVIREVDEIDSWHRAGSTPYSTRDQAELSKKRRKRWEFVGRLADESLRESYAGRSVEHFFRPGQHSPVVGVQLE